jgi:hypothetical protein
MVGDKGVEGLPRRRSRDVHRCEIKIGEVRTYKGRSCPKAQQKALEREERRGFRRW